jgi:hypothetical protein
MSKANFLLAFPFTLTIACGVGADDPATASTDQDVTVHDKCATGNQPNASLVGDGPDDVYTRSANTTNVTCGCEAWQREVNLNNGDTTQANIDHPDCRPGTVVNIDWVGDAGLIRYDVEVPSWSLTNGDEECSNSTLTIQLFKRESGSWVEVPPERRIHPQPIGGGVCGPLNVSGGGATDATYRIRAHATRGLFEHNHGYETVKIHAFGGFIQ